MAPALLILDLDETLLYASEQPLDRPADYRIADYHVYWRPHLENFIKGAATIFRLAVWTSAGSGYAAEAVKRIFPEGTPPEFVWSSSRCVRRLNPESVAFDNLKDLRKVKRRGYDLKRVLVVDDSPEKLQRHYGNHLRVRPFTGDPSDCELLDLLAYLNTIQCCENFRALEKRSWRVRIPQANGQ
jgi:TFIIF-interacting CTD phosphatase-like protein